MKVSLITATFNSEFTIKSCLDSVASQSYDDIEHLIIDGGSTDQTVSIVEDHATIHTNVSVVSEPDNGIYDALNKGIDRASGDIIGFVHSDDVLNSPDTISLIIENFQKNNPDGVYGDLKYVDHRDLAKTKRYWKSSKFHKNLLNRGWMPPHPTLFLRNQIYASYGLFDTKFKIAADYDFILRIFNKPGHTYNYIPEVFVLMRVGGESNKSIRNIIEKSKEDYLALKGNNMRFPFLILLKKNIQKVPQWFIK
ncbi:glycosyltransferase family 2 protein [Winogradskyella aurantiaca]|uniref:glycosyltransferase family 2 protein n=1 Tax=Winogradskyella aurantiaca TaxID=2219558 RepID=UPI000E1E257C|nr:glycosyltransferase family 2 protein [Winogradskyella aurantiaca]